MLKMKRIFRKAVPSVIRRPLFLARKFLASLLLPTNDNTFESDGFTTTHFLGFRTEQKFNDSFTKAIESLPRRDPRIRETARSIEWRAHITTWAANQALNLPAVGDFVECGVWHGTLSKTICEYLDFSKRNDRKFYLIDTYGKMTGSHSSLSYQDDIYEEVRSRFVMYPPIQIIRGLVPDCLEDLKISKVAYLSLDMNSSEPELKALEHFYPKMLSGGIIYFDDYGWGYPDLRKVVDNFFMDKPEKLMHFPSGNSIVVKI
jgi:hypothetical protein